MPKLKRTFQSNGLIKLTIVGGYPDGNPYLRFEDANGVVGNIGNKKEIKLLATNILKALRGKKRD